MPSVKSLLVRARISLAEAAEARKLSCEEVRLELGEVAEGLTKLSAPARRHLRGCDRCAGFKKQLKTTTHALAAMLAGRAAADAEKTDPCQARHRPPRPEARTSPAVPAPGSVPHRRRAGAGAAAGGGGFAGGMMTAGAGALATKAAAGLAAAALVTAGAVAATTAHPRRRPPPLPRRPRLDLAAQRSSPHQSSSASSPAAPRTAPRWRPHRTRPSRGCRSPCRSADQGPAAAPGRHRADLRPPPRQPLLPEPEPPR